LQSLDLLDDQTIRPTGSRYATWVLAQFDANNPRAVVNRDQLLETVYTGGGVEDVVYSRAFRLEPELFFVVLAALVANGDITLTIGRTVYDATKLPELAKLPWDERLKFSHIGKPRDIPQLAVEGLFEFFGIPRGRARSEHQQEQALPSVVDKALQYARELAELEGWLGALPPLLESALPDRTMLRKTYRELHEFLDKVPNYSTVGKLRSLPWTKEEIERYQTAWKAQVEPMLALKTRYQLLEPSLSYLKEARSLLSPDDPVAQDITVYLDSVGSGLLDAASLPSLQAAARELQILYIKRYEELHRRYRLSLPEDKARETLRQSSTWQTLSGLRAILPMTFGETFTQLEHQLTDLTVCTAPLSEDLKKSPECQCRFRPTDVHRPPSAVSWFATQAEDLLDRWTEAIFQHAQDPMVEDSIRLLDPAIQPAVRDVIARGEFLQIPPDESVLRALATLFQGLNSVEVDLDALVRDVGEGVPLTLEELKRRVNEALDQLGQGQDLAKTRFLLSRSRALTSNEV
ncbi:MAG: DUF6079 family protein, partial [Sulfobacillus sp.]|nr:DUF6079 family protein [Sulfobacillus sp.]